MKDQVVANDSANWIGYLQLIFITLKLTGHIAHWSWWWVFAPFWGAIMVVMAIALATVIVTWFTDNYSKK